MIDEESEIGEPFFFELPEEENIQTGLQVWQPAAPAPLEDQESSNVQELLPSSVDEVHLDKLTAIVDTALEELRDRVVNGDKKINHRTGEIDRTPINAKTLNTIIKTLLDRHDISRARIKNKKEATKESMLELITALRGNSKAVTIIDADLVNDNGLTPDEDSQE